MKIGAIGWTGNNIGDDIQTVALMQHLPPVEIFLNRDELNTYEGPKVLLVMNGWFLRKPQNWPPSDAIVPIFFGFHVQEEAKAAVAAHVDYLKKHQPIGCRDRATAEFIRSLGVEAYLSYCATLTFDAPADRNPDSIYVVESSLTKSLKESSGLTVREVSHRFIDVSPETRLRYARELVQTYGRRAARVITSRIHCALPCIGMGIPVIYAGKITPRTEILEEVGLRRSQPSSGLFSFSDKVTRWPEPLQIGDLKARIRGDLQKRIAQTLAAQ